MRRWLMVQMLLVLLGATLVPGLVKAQSDGDAICADALNGIAPRGYAIVRGSGGGGSQVVLGTDGPDVLSGGTGNDTLCGFGGDDVLEGGSGNDILVGGPGVDQLYGESGGDTLYGDTSDAVLDGGTGNNRTFRAALPPSPTPVLLTPCEQAAVDAGFDPADFTNIVPGTEEDDNFTGRETAGADLICGFGGSDVLNTLDAGGLFIGGAGDDDVQVLNGGVFVCGAGNDFVGGLNSGVLIGGTEDDVVDIMNGGTFDGGDGTDSVGIFLGGELFNTESPPSGPRP